jgi:HlyD family secretion protein
MMNVLNRLKIPLIVLVVVGIGFFALKGATKTKKDEVTYETGDAVMGDVRSFVTAQGLVQPYKIVDVKSNVGGKVDQLFVDLGDRVTQGQLIALIDPTDTNAAYAQTSADLDAAEARQEQAFTNLKQERLQSKARVASAWQSLASARARLAQAQASKTAQPILTQSSIAQARANLASARKSLAQAEKSRDQIAQSLEQLKDVTIPLNVANVQSSVREARANMLTAQKDYQRQRELMAQGYVSSSDVESSFSRLASMQAAVSTSSQRLKTLERDNQLSIQQEQARLDEAGARVESAQAQVQQAEASVKLAETNQVQDVLEERAYEAAQAAVEQAKAELESARAAENQIAVKQQDIFAARAQIVKAGASKKQADTNRTYTRITAPRTGYVIQKNIEQGTVVASSRQAFGSTSALLQIGDVTKQWVVCNVDETDVGQVSLEQKVSVKIDAFPSLLIDGKVIRIDPQAKLQDNVTFIPVTVEIDPGQVDPRFKPGMNADCDFIVDEKKNVLTVPNEALKEDNGTFYVEVMGADNKPQRVEVDAGLAGPETTEIRGGELKEGDKVITKTVVPEKAQATNPFGGPFGQRPPRQGAGGAAGGRGGGR